MHFAQEGVAGRAQATALGDATQKGTHMGQGKHESLRSHDAQMNWDLEQPYQKPESGIRLLARCQREAARLSGAGIGARQRGPWETPQPGRRSKLLLLGRKTGKLGGRGESYKAGEEAREGSAQVENVCHNGRGLHLAKKQPPPSSMPKCAADWTQGRVDKRARPGGRRRRRRGAPTPCTRRGGRVHRKLESPNRCQGRLRRQGPANHAPRPKACLTHYELLPAGLWAPEGSVAGSGTEPWVLKRE